MNKVTVTHLEFFRRTCHVGGKMCLKWNSLDEKCVQSKFSQSVNPPSLCLLEPGCPSVDVVLPLAGPEESPHGETEQRKSWVCLHPTHQAGGLSRSHHADSMPAPALATLAHIPALFSLQTDHLTVVSSEPGAGPACCRVGPQSARALHLQRQQLRT